MAIEGDYDIDIFSDSDMEMLETWADVLGQFEEILRESEGNNYVTTAHIPNWIGQLLRATSPRERERSSKAAFRAGLCAALETRLLPLVEVTRCPMYREETEAHEYVHASGVRVRYPLLAAALHPSYSDLPFLTLEERRLVWQRLRFEASGFAPRRHGPANDDEWSDWSDEDTPNGMLFGIHVDSKQIRRCMREYRDNMLQEGQLPCALEFWCSVERTWPFMAEVAKMVLCVPASSAESERTFSSCGFSDRRARGRSSVIGAITFCRKNIHVLGRTPREQVERVVAFASK